MEETKINIATGTEGAKKLEKYLISNAEPNTTYSVNGQSAEIISKKDQVETIDMDAITNGMQIQDDDIEVKPFNTIFHPYKPKGKPVTKSLDSYRKERNKKNKAVKQARKKNRKK